MRATELAMIPRTPPLQELRNCSPNTRFGQIVIARLRLQLSSRLLFSIPLTVPYL